MRQTIPFLWLAAVLATSCSDTSTLTAPVAPEATTTGTVAVPLWEPDRLPTPGAGDRILLDTRTSLQQAQSLERALHLFGHDEDDDEYLAFTTDVDGQGTNALRIDWPGEGDTCSSISPSIGTTLPNPRPTRLYIQWRQHLGQTATGGGRGEVGAFEVLNPACRGADRFLWTISREHSGELENRRVDLRWVGPAPAHASVNVKKTDLELEPNRGWSFLPQQHVGTDIVHTIYAEAESSPGAGDGLIRVWVGDRMLMEERWAAMGTGVFRRFNFPWTSRAPQESQSEYIWDVVAWEPRAVASVDVEPGVVELEVGETLALAAVLRDASGEALDYPIVRWSGGDSSVATISGEGVATAVAPGVVDVMATSQGQHGMRGVVVRAPAFYASPGGRPDASGRRADPWDLETALAGGSGRVRPGDTIWLLDGTYRGDFRSTLAGTADAPIVVRQRPGARATIDGSLRVDGEWVTMWGFEITQSDPLTGDMPALIAYAPGGRYVNLIVHDAGENGISFRTEQGTSEVYGCIVFNNGDDEHLDQGIYAPNDAGEKQIVDNVFFNNMASGIQVYADESHPRITSVRVEGNISFNNGSIAGEMSEENVTVGGDRISTENVSVVGNMLYFSGTSGQNLRAGLGGQDNRSVEVRGNYVAGGATVFRMEDWISALVEDNTFIGEARMVRSSGPLAGIRWSNNVHHRDPMAAAWNHGGSSRALAEWQSMTGLGATDRAEASRPMETRVFVRPNAYEAGRAHIAVFNWAGLASVAVDVAGVLRPGDRYEVRNVQDVFGAPVASGVYTGGALSLPMEGVEPPAAAGRPGTPPRTGPAFDAFLLVRTSPR